MNNGNDNQSIYAVRMLFCPNIYSKCKLNDSTRVRWYVLRVYECCCILVSTMSPVPQIITHSTVAVLQFAIQAFVCLCHCTFPSRSIYAMCKCIQYPVCVCVCVYRMFIV